MTFTVQRMRVGDVAALVDAFVVAWNKPPDQYARYWAENENGTRITLIAWVDGALAGYGNLLWRSDYPPFIEADISEINDLNTLEPFRGRGIASAIIGECEWLAAAHGKAIMGIGVGQTEDYANAQRLYPKLGYEYDGRGVLVTQWGGVEYLTKKIEGRRDQIPQRDLIPVLTSEEQRVLDQINDDELIGWVQALTRIPSVWKPETGEGEEAAARWVEAHCKEMGLETHFEFVAPGRPNVIARLPSLARGGVGEGGRTLMFEGHTDVVTEGDPTQWTAPPFSATLRDGKIYGRGANDMKAGVCCALMATRAIVQSGVKLNGDILLGMVCDEEGQMIGIKHFVEQGWADGVTACIVCEPEENHVCITQKGVMWVRAVIRGVMSHGAMPLTGVNSAYPMARFLDSVHALEERLIVQHGRHEFLGQPSITPTIVQSPLRGAGEPQKNVMPGAVETILDIRLIPGQDPQAIANALETMLQAACAVDPRLRYEMAVLEVRHPTQTERDHPVVQALASAYSSITNNQQPIYGGVPGSTDGTILNARKGIPIVTCGPGDIYIPHHVNEWVSVAEIKQAVRMYVLAAMRYLGYSSSYQSTAAQC